MTHEEWFAEFEELLEAVTATWADYGREDCFESCAEAAYDAIVEHAKKRA